MKRSTLTRHLRKHGCRVRREGKHEIWESEDSAKAAPVPRHQEIKDKLAAIICDQLGIPRVK
jgi:mRNA interferase HicA